MSAAGGAPRSWQGLPVVDAAAMRALDFDATARFGVPSAALMENAGAAVARETLDFLRGLNIEPAKARIVAACGRGANGGDGLVAARHLRQAGAGVRVFLCPPKAGGDYPALVRDNLRRAEDAGVEVSAAGPGSGLAEALASCDAALDALLGTGSKGKPAGAVHHMIQELVRSGKPVIAVDVPSGLDPDDGTHAGAAVRAALTLTLGLPKRGLLAPAAEGCVGRLKVLEIGYPPELLAGARPAGPSAT